MGKRRKARETVLMVLYQMDLRQQSLDEILKDLPKDETNSFATDLVKMTVTHLKEIDGMIRKIAKNWEFQRIALIDKNILRFAICELLYYQDIPLKVTIDEAIEIAKKYSTEESGRFVNGILDQVAKGIHPEKFNKS